MYQLEFETFQSSLIQFFVEFVVESMHKIKWYLITKKKNVNMTAVNEFSNSQNKGGTAT